MEFTKEDALQFLESLQVPKEVEGRCRDLMAQENYQETYRYLRSIRCEFLEDLHTSQKRLDQLDHLIYDIKKKNESEVCSHESNRR